MSEENKNKFFSGKDKDNIAFWTRFCANAALKGFCDVFDRKTTALPVNPSVLTLKRSNESY